jgi:hypothetical protein
MMGDESRAPSSKCLFDEILSSPCELALDYDDDAPVDNSASFFFERIWQKQPAIYHTTGQRDQSERARLQKLNIDWGDVADLLDRCRQSSSPLTDSDVTPPPLFFQQGRPITDPQSLYSSNPNAAYLDACSIIVNHADFHSSHVAKLCNSLQKTFPHVYANAYLTPPNGQAVRAHADDRDVLVVQILGQKTWRVYKNVPVQFPFEKEQVGKNGREVPSSVLTGDLCFGREVELYPGDVLYMPRGFVHEATTETHRNPSSPSFHLTFAIATHDWCLSVVLSDTIRQTLNNVTKFRKALPIGPSVEYCTSSDDSLMPSPTFLKQQLDEAMTAIQNQVTSELLEKNLRTKYDMHNFHADVHRSKIISTSKTNKRKRCDEIVGFDASLQLSLESMVRVSTPDERNSVVLEEGQLRGLTVRQETCSILMTILSVFKKDPSIRKKVKDLRGVIEGDSTLDRTNFDMICDFTLLCFARCCVELGAMAVVNF